MNKDYCKEDIGKIIRAERRPENYCENTSNQYAKFEMAMLFGGGICIVSLELSGDVIMTIRLMRMFGREPKYIIVPEIEPDNKYAGLIEVLGCTDRMCTYDDYMSNHFNENDMFIGCYMSKIQKKNMRVLRFRIQRKLSQKIKSVPLKNPVSDRLTKRSIPFVSWWWNRGYYDFMVYYGAHIKELEGIYDRLEDQTSKNILVELIREYFENDRFRLNESMPEDKYWECYRHLDDEKWVNCGSCNGDTIGWYLYKKFSYERIDAYEGDAKTFELLKGTMSLTNAENVNLYNEYIGLEGGSDTNFDARYADKGVTLINMDIEGAETGVLRGAKKLINQQKPVLAICAYHKPSDILDIPQIVLDAYSDYALYLRKYSDGYGGAGEYVYYFVPQDRKL